MMKNTFPYRSLRFCPCFTGLWLLIALGTTHLAAQNKVQVVTDANQLQHVRQTLNDSTQRDYLEGLVHNDKRVIAYIKNDLSSSKTAANLRGLYPLGLDVDIPAEAIDDAMRRLVYALLDKSFVRIVAIPAVPVVDPENGHVKLEAMLNRGVSDPSELGMLITSLGKCKPHPSSIDLLLRRLQKRKGMGPDQYLNGETSSLLVALLWQFAAATDEQAKQIAQAILDFVETSTVSNLIEQDIVRYFSARPTAEMLGFFESRLDDRDFYPYALVGYAKLQGQPAQSLVLNYLFEKAPSLMLSSAIASAWAEDQEHVLTLWLTMFDKIDEDTDQHIVLANIWNMGGEAMTTRFLNAIHDSPDYDRLQNYYAWEFLPLQPDTPLKKRAAGLYSLGLVPQELSDSTLETIRESIRKTGYYNITDRLLNQMPGMASKYIGSNPGVVYKEFIEGTLRRATLGKLEDLECYVETSEANDSEISKVWILLHDRGYVFEPKSTKNMPYDLAAIEQAMEMVCDDAGIEERFVPINFGDEYLTYLFAKPEIAKQGIAVLGLKGR